MLGRLKMDIRECIDAYIQLSESVFQPKRSLNDIIRRWKGRGKFNSEKLTKAIREITEKAGQNADAKLLEDDFDPKCKV